MNNLSVIIPSRMASNVIPCVKAVQECEPGIRIVVINDGLDTETVQHLERSGVLILAGKKPFGFPRNINIGIRAAGPDSDVILLNDDALLQTPYGFTLLQAEADSHPEYGIIGATTNVTGNPDMQPRDIGLRETDRALAFVCVLLPRRTINRVGLMDERFGGITEQGEIKYGFCDTDMCRRIRMTGLKVGIHDGCFVDHSSLFSSFRGNPKAGGDIRVCRDIYIEKWGDLAG
jgi:glycosyltransferase involved in cell wall biosynthesis